MARALGKFEIERMVQSPELFLMLDCDGTLAPLAKHYRRAVFSERTRNVLRKISKLPRVKVAVISGRSLKDVETFVGVRGLLYVGNHGLEVREGGKRRVHPKAGKSLKAIREAEVILKALIEFFPKACLENKRFGLSLHYRMIPPAAEKKLLFAFKTAIQPFVKDRKIRLLKGKKVLEVRPSIYWNKGHSARWLLQESQSRSVLPVFIGDDRTDEDAFGVLKKGITICVGRSKNTRAGFFLKSPARVLGLLETLYRERRKRDE